MKPQTKELIKDAYIDTSDLSGDIIEVINKLYSIKESYKDYNSVHIDIYQDWYDHFPSVRLIGHRDETKEETKRRIHKIKTEEAYKKRQQKIKDKKQLAHYKTLKVIYETP